MSDRDPSLDSEESAQEVLDSTTTVSDSYETDLPGNQAGCTRLPSDLSSDGGSPVGGSNLDHLDHRDNINTNRPSVIHSPSPPRSPLYKAWSLTIFNPTDQQYEVLRTWNEMCDELVVCREIAPTTGSLHLHVYVAFPQRKRMEAVKKLIGQDVHCKFVKAGCTRSAILYVHKESSEILYDKTVERTQQGHIILDTMGMLRDGKSDNEVIVAQPSLAYRPGTVSYLKRLASEEIALERFKAGFKPQVLWFWGETGTGKSRTACGLDEAEKICLIGRARKNGTPWFNAYDPVVHDTVIFDDFRWDWFEFDELLRLLDYTRKHMVEVKGSSVYWIPKRIIITTCKDIRETFTSRGGWVEENIAQLVRRVDESWQFVKFNDDYTVYKVHPITGKEIE